MHTVLVVGSGAMGSQIAMVTALAGYQVALFDIQPAALDKARSELRARTARMVEKGKLTAADEQAAHERLTYTTSLTAADLVIEAAVEKLHVKRQIFAELDTLLPPHAIFASNSSSFVPSSLASAVNRTELVCNLHFFNPALVMKCVEVVPGPATAPSTVAQCVDFVNSIGKTPVVLDKEIHGFIANRILNAVRDEAIRLHEGGIASVEAIDTACRTALGYPMGPFELMDLTGIDIGYHVKQARFAETGNPADAPSRSVTELVERGQLGRKTGQGWYSYPTTPNGAQ